MNSENLWQEDKNYGKEKIKHPIIIALTLILLLGATISGAILLSFGIIHEFKGCSEWFGQDRKMWDYRNGHGQTGNYVISRQCLYCGLFDEQKCQDLYEGKVKP